MKCKKCGADLPEGGIYCSVCGERNDGKKPCPKCGKLIDENTVFCTYCGERVDGKRVCPKCGSVSDGNFCNSCGEPLEESELRNEVAATETPTQNGFKFTEIFRINGVNCLPSILALLGLLLMAIFSFFVGFNGVAETNGEKTVENWNVFYFLSEIYEQTSNDGIIVNKIIGSVFAIIILCVPTCVFIFAAFDFVSKYVLDINRDKSTNLIKLSFITLAVFSVSVLVLYSRNAYSGSIYSGDIGFKASSQLNAFCYLGMILPFVMFVFSLLAKLATAENKWKWKYIKRKDIATSFLGILIIILLFVSVVLTSRYPLVISISINNSYQYGGTLRATFYSFLNSFSQLSQQYPHIWERCLSLAVIGDLSYVAFAALFISAVSSVIKLIRNEDPEINGRLIVTSLEMLLAIANLVYSSLFLQKLTKILTESNKDSSTDNILPFQASFPSAIIVLVLSIISFTIAIICTSIKKREESY